MKTKFAALPFVVPAILFAAQSSLAQTAATVKEATVPVKSQLASELDRVNVAPKLPAISAAVPPQAAATAQQAVPVQPAASAKPAIAAKPAAQKTAQTLDAVTSPAPASVNGKVAEPITKPGSPEARRNRVNTRITVPITDSEPALQSTPDSGLPQTVAGTSLSLRDDTREIAEITGTLPILQQLIAEQNSVTAFKPHTIEMVEKKQRILYLRQKLIQHLDTALFEINCADGKIQRSTATLADAEADLNEHRARTIRRNTMINFISGGVTKMVGYGMALGEIGETATNLLEVFDGGIQSTLSGATIRDQKVENRMMKGVPGFMTTLVAQPVAETNEYPPIVWKYLNNVPPGGKTTMTRRELLIKNWKQHGIMKSQLSQMKTGPNGQLIMSSALEGKWIADHSAMMSDLKSVISQMNTGLMVLSELVKDSYNVDPVF